MTDLIRYAPRCLLMIAVAGWIGCSDPEPDRETSAALLSSGACTPNETWPCYSAPLDTDGIGACQRGIRTCNADGTAWGACVGEVTPSAEVCGDEIDNDCNGHVDEDCTPACVPTTETCGDYLDNDCDGNVDEGCVCAPGEEWTCYSAPLSTDGIGACQRGVKTCSADGFAWGACEGEVTPSAEVCGDQIDNDCDGTVDEGCRLLRVLKAGTGTGLVTSAPSGIDCGAACTLSYAHGTVVTLTAAASAGSTFVGWTGACTGTGTCVVTMTASRTVTARFNVSSGSQVLTVVRAGPGSGTVSSAPAGINCGAACSATYATGTMVTLTAAAAVGSTFTGWSGACTGTGTCVVTMNAATTVTATFGIAAYPLTVVRAGPGSGTVSSTPAGINCGATCSASYATGTAVTLTAAAAVGSTFTGWSGACTGTGTCVVTMTAATTVTATFGIQRHALTVARAGSGSGTVASAPAGIDCGATCAADFDDGTTVTLTATAAPGSRFIGWSGSGCSGTGTCVVTMTAARTVTATFTPMHTLTVTRAGSGSGTVASAPAGIDCGATCAADFVDGTVVTLTAAATAADSHFVGWSGAGCSGTGTCVVTMTAARAVTATFIRRVTLTVVVVGSGTVTSTPAGVNCGAACTLLVDAPTTVALTAAPGAGMIVRSWAGASGCDDGAHCSVLVDTDLTVTVTFGLPTLTVIPEGTGTGTVDSAPDGIDCGADCISEYPAGTVVTLTPTPQPGSRFDGWTGPCINTVGDEEPVVVGDGCRTGLDADADGLFGCADPDCAGDAYCTTCGNGALNTDELCDDGNRVPGDGCNASCLVESGFTCRFPGRPCVTTVCDVATVGTSSFQRNNYVEMGLHRNGAFGTYTSPAPFGWHPRSGQQPGEIGFVADPAGTNWTNYHGDFFTPGSPEEGWALVVGSNVYNNNREHGPLTQMAGETGAPECVSNLCGRRDGARVSWESSAPVAGQVDVRQDYTILDGGVFILIDVYLTNVTGTDLTNVYYMRNVDPDNDQTRHGSYTTNNTILAQPNAADDLAMVRATQNISGISSAIALVARDDRARVTFGSFSVRDPRQVWHGTGGLSQAGSNVGDVAISVAFKVDIPAGQTVGFRYAYNLEANASDVLTCVEHEVPNLCVVQVDSDTEVTAHWSTESRPLHVTKIGTGTGTVTSAPAAIDCGPTCDADLPRGSLITLTATPEPGSRFAGWSGSCTGTGPCSLAMTGARNVTAEFVRQVTLTVVTEGDGSVGSWPPGIDCGTSCQLNVDVGTGVDLYAYPGPGAAVASWTGASGCAGTYCFVAVDTDLTVTVVFAPTAPLTVIPEGTGEGRVVAPGYDIDCSGCNECGSGGCTSEVALGAIVTLTATPYGGSRFDGWSGPCITTTVYPASGEFPARGECVVSIDGATEVVAYFNFVYRLDVAKTGDGNGVVTSTPAGIDCGFDCAEEFIAGTTVALSAAADPGSVFVGWEVPVYETYAESGGVPIPDDDPDGASMSVVVPTSMYATYFNVSFHIFHPYAGDLFVTLLHDGVPYAVLWANYWWWPYPDINESYGFYLGGDPIGEWSIQAVDSAGGNVGGIESFSLAFNGVRVTPTLDPFELNANTYVTAFFAAEETLTVTTLGTGTGTVTSAPAGIDCGTTCQAQFGRYTDVVLTATASPDSTFLGWSGACSGTGPCVVAMDGAQDVAATFSNGHRLLLATEGTGAGTITGDQGGLDCGPTCEAIVDGPVTLVATAAPGSELVGWIGGGCSGTGPCVVTLTAETLVVAVFDLSGPPLTIAFAGDGTGTVYAVPGVSCTTGCTHTYTAGTALEMIAEPAFGSTFVGWSGACTGTDPCFVTIDAATSLVARFEIIRYPLSVARLGSGTGTVTSTPAGIDCGLACTHDFTIGTTVTLAALPAPGSRFAGWGGACVVWGMAPCVLDMNDGFDVEATFIAQHTVTVAVTGNGTVQGSFGIDCGTACDATVDHGELVELYAFPEPGYAIGTWTDPSCSGSTCLVTVEADRTIGVTFVPQAILNVALAGTGTGTVTSAPDGIDCGFDCTHGFAIGQTVTLTATPDANAIFTGWSGACTGTGACVVTLTDTTDVTATFTLAYQLVANRIGTGTGTVTSAPAGIDCGATCATAFTPGTVVTLTATPAPDSRFVRWDNLSTDPTRVVTMGSNVTVTAVFAADYTLAVTKAGSGGGTLYESTFDFTCGAGCGGFTGEHLNPGFPVHLSANPDPGAVFVGWSGACTGTGTCDVVMTGDTIITATFSRTHLLTVVRAGAGAGQVVSTPSGIDCGALCATTVLQDVPVTLVATAAPGSAFVGWSPALPGCIGATCTLSVTAATTITATFAPAVTLTIEVIGGDGVGVVRTLPDFTTCTGTCTREYPLGAGLLLNAIPSAGLAAWGGDCSGDGLCIVSMTTSRTVTATFRPRHPLTITHAGAAAGTVTSAPAGIDCGASCTATFFETEQITLTAAPDGTSAFLGWSGACSNAFGPCVVTIAGATAVTARFDVWEDPDLVAVPPLPPFEPHPNAQYDEDGRLIVGIGAEVTITVDTTPSASTALQECAFTVVNCVRSGAGTLDECVFSMPRCTTDQPWEEAVDCCAPACWDSYRESRRQGADPMDALDHALFAVPSCMPGIDPQRGLDSGVPSTTFAEEMLTVHNQKRALHCVPALEWSSELEAASYAYAQVLLDTRIWEHSPEARAGEHGENLEFDNSPAQTDIWRATLWYDEIAGYDWDHPGQAIPGFTDPIGHFTQWVWKRNQTVGCGKASDGTVTYLVCKYGPGGNVTGDYERNVLPLCAP